MHRSVLVQPGLAAWTSHIEARYETLEATRHRDGPVAASRLVSPGQRFVPTASSFTIGECFAGENLNALVLAILAGPAGGWIRNELNTRIACDVDQSWVRRQYAPQNYPPWHAPHGWHQDGALGFDFSSHGDREFPPGAVLSMVTCWIALTPCGADAPGLEFITRRLKGLCAPAELTEASVGARFAAQEFCRPMLAAGDALSFRGDLLHRTHVIPAMTRNRTSLELRFFPAESLPPRLKGDLFLPLVSPQSCRGRDALKMPVANRGVQPAPRIKRR